jgi:hypothetical protein
VAARTALVVRQPAPPAPSPAPVVATPKRRGRNNNRGKMGVRQGLIGLGGAATSALVSAGLCHWLGWRPQWTGLAAGTAGVVTAFLADGPVRPFATGMAIGGGTVALSSWVGRFQAPEKKDEKKDQGGQGGQKQLTSGGPDVVSAPPANAKDANSPQATAKQNANSQSGYRSGSTVSDQMRQQIRQAMRDTQYRAG